MNDISDMGTSDNDYTMAFVSFVLALVGLCASVFCAGFLFAIGSIVCGHIALTMMKRTRDNRGRPFALAGVIISYFHLAVYVLIVTGVALIIIFRDSKT